MISTSSSVWVKTVIINYEKLFVFVASKFEKLIWNYFVSLGIQFECGKIRARITPNTDTFYAVNVSLKVF